jgi:integrase
MCEILPKDIIAWQNEMINHRDEKDNPYSPVYLKTLHNQLSALFNHAVKFYGLAVNPASKVGNMGKAKSREMLFWTKEEYLKFADVMMDKPISFYAFEMLYWCGIREGELLALTPVDFDFERKTVSITKSYVCHIHESHGRK